MSQVQAPTNLELSPTNDKNAELAFEYGLNITAKLENI